MVDTHTKTQSKSGLSQFWKFALQSYITMRQPSVYVRLRYLVLTEIQGGQKLKQLHLSEQIFKTFEQTGMTLT